MGTVEQPEESWVEGFISVAAVLAAGNRPVHEVFVQRPYKQRGERHVAQLQQLAAVHKTPFTWVDADFVAAQASGKSHGGILARVGGRRFVPLTALAQGVERPFLVMLDGIEDPFNFGQAVRALYAAGATGLVLRPRNWMSAADVVTRASAGTTEWIPTAVVETAEEAAQVVRPLGLAVVCTSETRAVPMYDADLAQPLFLLLGGEKRGITRSFLDQADLLVRIPYQQTQFSYALGAAMSAAILGFEVMRQRRGGER